MSVCMGRKPDCTHVGCHKESFTSCKFALSGRRAGEPCGARICEEHAVLANNLTGGLICLPHARMLAAAATKQKKAA